MSPDLSQPTHWFEKKIHLGASSSWDSKPVISVRRTESSTVGTMRCWQRRLTCSERREPTNISLGSRKCCQWLSIWRVIPWCDGMTGTTTLERRVILLMRDTENMDPSSGKNNWYFFFYANPEEEFLFLLASCWVHPMMSVNDAYAFAFSLGSEGLTSDRLELHWALLS